MNNTISAALPNRTPTTAATATVTANTTNSTTISGHPFTAIPSGIPIAKIQPPNQIGTAHPSVTAAAIPAAKGEATSKNTTTAATTLDCFVSVTYAHERCDGTSAAGC